MTVLDNKMVVVKDLVKYYGDFQALKGVSFEVRKGEVFGLLGPNGAGKTTTIKILVGLLEPDGGTVSVLGKSPVNDPVYVKSVIGYIPEEVVLYNSLTPREFLEFVISVRKLNSEAIELAKTLSKSFDLDKYWDQPIATLSQGNKQKVAIIAALIHRPEVLVLDEPIKGLDAKSAKLLKELIRMHVENGGSVIFSTHIMDIAASLCDRIAIIHEGRILAQGTMGELTEMTGGVNKTLEEVFLELTREKEEIKHMLEELRGVLGDENENL